MRRISALVAFVLMLAGTLAVLPGAFAAKPGTSSAVPLQVHVYDSVVDEHNTNVFYNSSGYCTEPADLWQWGNNPLGDRPLVTGDGMVDGPTTAYAMGEPWTLWTPITSTTYANGADCGPNCLRAQITSSGTILSVDTRGTAGPRTMTLDFSHPYPDGSSQIFGTPTTTTTGLFDVFLDVPYLSMTVCSSTGCPEARLAFARFWFTDPANPDVSWRVEWQFVRVLRLTADTWHVIADACDGTQIASLSRLTGNRGKPKAVFTGYYLIPFFHAAVRQ